MTVLLLLGAICFLLAFISGFAPRLGVIPWLPLGLFFWILTELLPKLGVNLS